MAKQKIYNIAKYALMVLTMICVAFMFVACDAFGDKNKDNDGGTTSSTTTETQAQMQAKYETAHANSSAYKGSVTIVNKFNMVDQDVSEGTKDVINKYTYNALTNEVAYTRTNNPQTEFERTEYEYIVANGRSELVLYDSNKQPDAYYVLEKYVQNNYGVTFAMDDGDTLRNFFGLISEAESEVNEHKEGNTSYSKTFTNNNGKYTMQVDINIVDEVSGNNITLKYIVVFGDKIEKVHLEKTFANETTNSGWKKTHDYQITYAYDATLMQKTFTGFNEPTSTLPSSVR